MATSLPYGMSKVMSFSLNIFSSFGDALPLAVGAGEAFAFSLPAAPCFPFFLSPVVSSRGASQVKLACSARIATGRFGSISLGAPCNSAS